LLLIKLNLWYFCTHSSPKAERAVEKQLAVLKALTFASASASSGLWGLAASLMLLNPVTDDIGVSLAIASGVGDVVVPVSMLASSVAAIALGSSLLSALFALLAHHLDLHFTDRFISGMHRWKRAGGLSLVKIEWIRGSWSHETV
jgi:hypothetical protein